jgi:hypothetical protein
MTSKLDALKAAFAPSAKKEGGNFTFTKFYNFWKMAAGETAIVRFLKDSNPDNPRQFIVENLTHSFTINGKKRVVACLSMYGKPCPACEVSRDLYDQAAKAGETKDRPGVLMAQGKKFYRKKEYIGQVKVQTSPIEYEKNEGHEHEMPVAIGPQIFKLIQAAFSSGDLEEVPFSDKGGYDFRIIKSEQGGNANYTLSKFAPKQTDLSDDVIAQLNLYDLSTLRNRETDRATMEAMIIADRTGQPLVLPTAAPAAPAAEDDSLNFTSSKAVAEAVATTTTSAQSVADEPAATESAPAEPAASKVNDVLAQIRARAAANKAA